MKCKLVDVFAKKALSGNGLTIFYDYDSLSEREMLSLTQEMRQFESIFVEVNNQNGSIRAKIFTVEEELDFAGHPLVGLAAHLHEESGDTAPRAWDIELNKQKVRLTTRKTEHYFYSSMSQGKPDYIRSLCVNETETVLAALNLCTENVADYPLEVISTGLPYLIVPIDSGIESARICVNDFENLLASFGAKFVYIIDILNFEGRTWDNHGAVEDIATGSAAGPTAAYLVKHNLASGNTDISISQGRFLGRPSTIEAFVETEKKVENNIWISGDVVKVADINFV